MLSKITEVSKTQCILRILDRQPGFPQETTFCIFICVYLVEASVVNSSLFNFFMQKFLSNFLLRFKITEKNRKNKKISAVN